MTWEELIAKAEEHARRAGIPAEQLQKPKVRETALVTFLSKSSTATARFHLDAITGDLISAEFSGPEFTPNGTGKQFSKRAQRVLALASEESRRMGCDHVGSDHLLLALLVYGEGSGLRGAVECWVDRRGRSCPNHGDWFSGGGRVERLRSVDAQHPSTLLAIRGDPGRPGN